MVKSKAWNWEMVEGKFRDHWQEPAEESYYLINRWKKQGKKDFLDLGCGLGRHTLQFAKAGFKVSGFDLSEEAIKSTGKSAKEQGLEVDLKVGDMLDLPYEDGSFDCVYCRNVISHADTEGIKQILAEIYRVLKKDGECYLTLCSKQSWGFQQDWPMVDENTKIRIEDGPENGVPHFYADFDLAIELLKDFQIVKIYQIEDFVLKDKITNSFHYHVLVRKD